MLGVLTVGASALYLVPLVALVALLRRERDDALDLAGMIATVFAVDLLGTFALCYLVPLEQAAFVRTGVLVALAAAVAVRRALRGERVVRPRAGMAPGDLGALVLAAALGLWLSHMVSSESWIWDREWHVPFTAGLRAQRMPFRNVYEPDLHIRYHLAGDLFAAMLQSLSFATMNASRALSVAHDIQSLLLVGITALIFRATCPWSPLVAALAAPIPFLVGPIGLRAGSMGMFEGYSDFNNFTLSFRPHCMISLVVLTGLLARVMRLARNRDAGRPPALSSLAGLLPLFGLSAITDEISTAAVGVVLAVLWLAWPDLLGTSRRRGLVLLALLAGTALVANLVLAGTIGPGGPVEHARWVAPRLPHFSGAPLALGLRNEAWRQLLVDEGPIVIPAVVLVRELLARRGGHAALVSAAMVLGVAAVGLLLFLCFEMDGRTYEGHRFMTAARILLPVVALTYAPRLPRGSFATVALLAPLFAGAVTSWGYAFSRLPQRLDVRGTAAYATDCRRDFGARVGEPMVPTYVDEPIWYPYAGCRPIFAAGHDGPPGAVLAGWPMLGPAGFAKMDRAYFAPGVPARVVCPAGDAYQTFICAKAERVGVCQHEGKRARACAIPLAARSSLGAF
jgi:hypothetical protein